MTLASTVTAASPSFSATGAAIDRRLALAVVALGLFAAVFSSQLVPGSSLLIWGDMLLIAMVALTFLSKSLIRWTVGIGQYASNSIGVILLGFAISAIANVARSGFMYSELAGSIIKLLLYLVSFAALAQAIDMVGATAVARLIRLSLVLLTGVAIAQQVAYRLGVTAGILATYGSGRFDRASFPRSASLFSEPAYLSIFVVMSIVVLYRLGLVRRVDLGFGLLLIGLSASLAGVLLVIIASGSVLAARFSPKRILRGLLLGLLLAVAVSIPPVEAVFEARVLSRVEQTLDGRDQSGSGRLFDSWRIVGSVPPEQLVFGVGLGQLDSTINEALQDRRSDGLDRRLAAAGGTWNVFANVLLQGGLISLVGLALFVLSIGRRWWPGAVVLVGIGFSTGTFFGWLWWLVLYMLFWASRQASPTHHAAAPGAELLLKESPLNQIPRLVASEQRKARP